MSNAYTKYSRHIINTLLTVLIASTAALYPACEHEMFPQTFEREERELVEIEPHAEQKMEPEVTQEIKQNQAAVAANPQQIRAALDAALKNQNSEEGSEQLQALLEHEIAKMPEKIREPLLNYFLKQAFLVQKNPDDTYAMELLLEAKADPNLLIASDKPDQASLSALHVATMAGNTQAVQLFLDHGADPLVTSDNGLSCLEMGSNKKTHTLLVHHTIQRLKTGRLDPNYQDPHTRQPLLSMALSGPVSFLPQIPPLVKELLERHAHPNTPDKRRYLPLHIVLGYKRVSTDLAKQYVQDAQEGGNAQEEEEEFYRALHELEEMLREHGAQEEASPANNGTCLIQ